MFERFTDRARKVMALANREALSFNNDYIDTGHILLGLVSETSGVGVTVLKNLNIDRRQVRKEVEKLIPKGPEHVVKGKLPHTPRAKKVIEYAIEEANLLRHNYVGTEHLLLGLMRDSEGIGAQALKNLGLDYKKVRNEVEDLLGMGREEKDNVVSSQEENSIKEEKQSISIAGHSVSDQATRFDTLGFKPYVNAVAEFLVHKDTKPPLTMSIEGEWGSGKSSFMLQLKDELNKRGELTVSFSPWRHDKEDSLWAAFALSFTEQIQNSTGWFRCFLKNIGLMFSRFDWRQGWPEALKVLLRWIAFILIFAGALIILYRTHITFLNDIATKIIATVLGVFLITWKLLGEVKDIVGNPLKHDLNKYTSKLDYGARICFAEKFHKDFGKIVNAYAGNRRVYVFVDDLDRCEVPKAADLMKAINLMISDDPALCFILGMDRIKVAAGLAVKDKDMIPYLISPDFTQAKTERGPTEISGGVMYGCSFIEKFIQLPFDLPKAGSEKLQEMLGPTLSEELDGLSKTNNFYGNDISSRSKSDNTIDGSNENNKREIKELGLKLGTDSEEIQAIVKMVCSALDHNPRRIKQFVNLFRLRAYILFETGALNYLGTKNDKGLITLEQLGKIIAISLRWPLILKASIEDAHILKLLSAVADGRKGGADTGSICQWENDKKLMELIQFGCKESERHLYSLEKVEICNIMSVLPRISSLANQV